MYGNHPLGTVHKAEIPHKKSASDHSWRTRGANGRVTTRRIAPKGKSPITREARARALYGF